MPRRRDLVDKNALYRCLDKCWCTRRHCSITCGGGVARWIGLEIGLVRSSSRTSNLPPEQNLPTRHRNAAVHHPDALRLAVLRLDLLKAAQRGVVGGVAGELLISQWQPSGVTIRAMTTCT